MKRNVMSKSLLLFTDDAILIIKMKCAHGLKNPPQIIKIEVPCSNKSHKLKSLFSLQIIVVPNWN